MEPNILTLQRCATFAVMVLAETLAENEGVEFCKLDAPGRSVWIAAALERIDSRLSRRAVRDVAEDMRTILGTASDLPLHGVVN